MRELPAFLAIPFTLALIAPSRATAEEIRPWQMGFHDPATENMETIVWFHDWFLMPIITAISLFVLGLLLYCMARFNARANPVPSKRSHNTPLEIIWTVIPALILIVIAVPSFRLLAHQTTIPADGLTIKATGHQWYWSYQYPDHEIEFDATLIPDDQLKEGDIRLLSTDNPVVVPVNTNVRIITTASDVLHAWAIPAFGVKMDSVPGRLNETWFHAKKRGVYYGQCSELCGTRHAYMPIEVRVVSRRTFQRWLAFAKREFAAAPALEEKPRKLTESVKGDPRS